MALLVLATNCALLLISTASANPSNRVARQLVTCPGFPGYCSESYAGDTCLVVCARGRNNVPECQEDGTWTDVPRCIEHEPGVDEQVPGVCPGVPGYCSLDTEGGLCTFECSLGAPIRSTCTKDGTWEPYPTCRGDLRETQDGCNPCPGPLGGFRNRTAEAAGGGASRGQANLRGSGGFRNQVGSRSQGNPRKQSGHQNTGNSRNQGNSRAQPSTRGQQGSRRNQGGSRKQGAPRSQSGFRSQSSSRNQVANSKFNNGGRSKSNRNNFSNKSVNAKNRNTVSQPRRSGGSRKSGSGGARKNAASCPGSVLQDCIDVCPGFSSRVFSACVNGCAKRCPGRK